MQPTETNLSELLGERLSQRNALGDALVLLGKEFPDLFVLSPDVGPSTKAIRFRDRFPERYVCSGIDEMNTTGLAAGLAYLGYIPLVAGYAMFVAGKAWEPFRNSIAYPNLNVKLVGTHAGINVGPDGVTHQAIEDLALMRSIPNVHVLVPTDATQVLPALRRAMAIQGPVYIRIEREPLPTLQINHEQGQFHDFYEILPGGNIKLLAIGGMVGPCVEAALMVNQSQENSIGVIAVTCLKPLNIHSLEPLLQGSIGLVTAEDHNILGGLGSSLAEALAQENPMPIEIIGVRDTFAASDTCQELKKCFGLTTEHIIQAIHRICQRAGK